MKQFEYVIKDELGIHARPAGMLVKAAGKYNSTIHVEKDGKNAEMKKLFGMMGLGVKCGDTVIVRAEGEDEDAAIKEVKAIFEENL